MKYKVCIFLSTYNGEKYIKQQLDSLLSQENVDIKILIRDDQSTDNTIIILKEYEKRYPNNISLFLGKNVGCEESFFELLSYGETSDYYAFCDQDDIWDSRKCIKEIALIENERVPALVACNLMVCDEAMNKMGKVYNLKFTTKYKKLNQQDVLFSFHGCTLLWNRQLQSYIEANKVKFEVAHDVWLCVLSNVLGKSFYLDEPLVMYRQHGDNVSGFGLNFIDKIKNRINLYLGEGHPRRDVLAKEILEMFNDVLVEQKREQLEEIATYKKNLYTKLKFINNYIVKVKKFPQQVFWSLCVLLGKY